MINRGLYKGWFTQENMLKWQCPTCNSSSLHVIQDKFIQQHNSATEINYNEDWFDAPEMIVYTFTALLSCTNPTCKEVVACSGTGSVETEHYHRYDGEYDRRYIDYFKPYFFYPSLQIFLIPEDTPKDVKEAIQSSFSIVFSNKLAAANQIRVALECLLTHLGVKRFTNSRGKRHRLKLHDRILHLSPKFQHIKDLCLAIKWLGNSGSHCGDEMTFDNVFDGYDMLSFLLDEVYANRKAHAEKLAKKINAKKGV